MLAVAKKEFFDMFKSFKSITVILSFIVTTFSLSRIFTELHMLPKGLPHNVYSASLQSMVMFSGFLFVFSLSHDCLNREIETRTMRFIVTKQSRISIILGKFLGLFSFWFICTFFAFSLVSIFAKQFVIMNFVGIMLFLVNAISLNMLVSIVIKKSTHSMFFGIIIGSFMPPLGMASIASSNMFLHAFRYVVPHYSVVAGSYHLLIPALWSVFLVGTTIFLFQRRNL